jgi:uncharacterized protein YqjF (DUF2071 family)
MDTEMIDRISPTRRPAGKAAGFQRWRSLLFLHWPVQGEILRSLVPAELSLDLHDGVAYVGVVPFAMQGVRPWWCPEAFAFSFLETNVRTYVLSGDRPGVYFFSLDANSRVAVFAARTEWGLPYHYARIEMSRSSDEICYHTRRASNGAVHQVRYQLGEHLGVSRPGTLEHFLLERYLLFVKHKGQLLAGQVHHTPYPVQKVHLLEVHDELMAAAGFPATCKLPALAHYSPGVDVEVFSLLPK